MSLRDDWKNTGKSLGGAFGGLGKNIVRSAKAGINRADNDGTEENKSDVFNDGSWRQTGKDLGGAFAGLGKSIIRSAKTGIDKVDGSDSKKEDAPETDGNSEN